MTGTLKIPPSTLVKSRQQNVGGSFYRVSRHDPCKLFKVIQIDIFRQKLPSKNITSLHCANILETFDHPAEYFGKFDLMNILETFDHPAEAKI